MKKLVVLVLAVPVLALAACGSSDPSPKDQITSIIKDVGKTPQSLCDKYASTALLAQAGGKAACEKAAKAPTAADPNIKVDSVTVTGDKATATITGNSGGNTVSFEKQNGKWKVVGTKSS